MQLKKYQCYVHGSHVDVELTFKGQDTIKLCECSNYNGNIGAFGDPIAIAPVVREDLGHIANSGQEVEVKRDKLDGSIDIFTPAGVLLFSMEAERVEGADWVREYDSSEA